MTDEYKFMGEVTGKVPGCKACGKSMKILWPDESTVDGMGNGYCDHCKVFYDIRFEGVKKPLKFKPGDDIMIPGVVVGYFSPENRLLLVDIIVDEVDGRTHKQFNLYDSYAELRGD